MSDRLPPLTALRAFEAAARHMSFAGAAEELNVTPAALSFQIKSLETHLGEPLFRRLNRAVELTEAGRALAPGATEGFTRLQAAWRAARRSTETGVVTVTAGPAFTAKWLAPRLFKFAAAHPEIELRFAASMKLLDFERDEIDVAIRFGLPHGKDDAGLYSEPLVREWMTPMMSPALAEEIRTPADLARATLLSQDDLRWLKPLIDWNMWFRVAGLGAPPKGGPHFSQADHAIDAAISGGGVVLGRGSLAASALLNGQLVAPFEPTITTKAHFRFLCREGQEERPQIAAFLEWIRSETGDLETLAAGRSFVAASDIAALPEG